MTNFQRYALSSLTTFAAAAVLALASQIVQGMTIEWTISFWFALISVAIRAGVKALLEGAVGQNADPVSA